MTPEPTVGSALAAARAALAAGGIAGARLEARLLLAGASGLDAAAILARPEAALDPEAGARLSHFVARRLGREPVARILGAAEFWGLPFRLSPATLVPRPDTETVVEAALRALAGRPSPRILDLGTGSGCILVACLHERPDATGIGLDRSAEAAATARLNARLNGVAGRSHFVVSDWAAAITGEVDLLVSNPPYIATDVIAGLERDVRDHDPRLALDGGADGLDAYRRLVAEADRLLAPGGTGVFEIGYDQGRSVGDLAAAAGFSTEIVQDLAGHDRAVVFRRST